MTRPPAALRLLLRLPDLPGLLVAGLAFVPLYLAGAAWEAARVGWRAGRQDVRNLTADGGP